MAIFTATITQVKPDPNVLSTSLWRIQVTADGVIAYDSVWRLIHPPGKMIKAVDGTLAQSWDNTNVLVDVAAPIV